MRDFALLIYCSTILDRRLVVHAGLSKLSVGAKIVQVIQFAVHANQLLKPRQQTTPSTPLRRMTSE
jgi:hypothetical protein